MNRQQTLYYLGQRLLRIDREHWSQTDWDIALEISLPGNKRVYQATLYSVNPAQDPLTNKIYHPKWLRDILRSE